MKNTLKIGYVGYVNSEHDITMKLRTLEYLLSKKIITNDTTIDEDQIDLNKGRDFLLENKCYDIVVVCYIYRYKVNNLIEEYHKEFTQSPRHTWVRWCKRLKATKANYIFLFGHATEITASFIGDLEGYIYNSTQQGLDIYINSHTRPKKNLFNNINKTLKNRKDKN